MLSIRTRLGVSGISLAGAPVGSLTARAKTPSFRSPVTDAVPRAPAISTLYFSGVHDGLKASLKANVAPAAPTFIVMSEVTSRPDAVAAIVNDSVPVTFPEPTRDPKPCGLLGRHGTDAPQDRHAHQHPAHEPSRAGSGRRDASPTDRQARRLPHGARTAFCGRRPGRR